MHRGQQTLPGDWGICKKVEYKEAADFFSSQANSACYPGGIHISGLVHRGILDLPRYAVDGSNAASGASHFFPMRSFKIESQLEGGLDPHGAQADIQGRGPLGYSRQK
jgi:hypothetical protein